MAPLCFTTCRHQLLQSLVSLRFLTDATLTDPPYRRKHLSYRRALPCISLLSYPFPLGRELILRGLGLPTGAFPLRVESVRPGIGRSVQACFYITRALFLHVLSSSRHGYFLWVSSHCQTPPQSIFSDHTMPCFILPSAFLLL